MGSRSEFCSMGCDLRAPLIQAKAVQEATADYFALPPLELLILVVKKRQKVVCLLPSHCSSEPKGSVIHCKVLFGVGAARELRQLGTLSH